MSEEMIDGHGKGCDCKDCITLLAQRMYAEVYKEKKDMKDIKVMVNITLFRCPTCFVVIGIPHNMIVGEVVDCINHPCPCCKSLNNFERLKMTGLVER